MQTWVRTLSKLVAFAGVALLATACGQPATLPPSPAPIPSTSTPAPPSPTPPAAAALPTATSLPPSPTRAPAATLPPPSPTPETASATATATPPAATPTPTETPGLLVAIVSDVLRVRSGPGPDYPVLGRLQPDTQLILLARSADGGWFQIAYPAGSNQRGWVSAEFLRLQGSPDQAPLAQAPPPPSPTPTMPSLSATPASAATAGALGIVSDTLRVRGGPGADYPILGRLQPGAQVTLLLRSVDARWFQIVYPSGSDQTGWVSAEFVQLQSSSDQAPLAQAPPAPSLPPGAAISPTLTLTPSATGTPTATVTAGALVGVVNDVLRVRGGPSTDYDILGRLQPGTRVALLARSADGGWFQIAYPPGSDQRGWVKAELLQLQGSPDQAPLAQAPPTPAAVEACAPIPDQKYGTLGIASAPTDRPAASHPDLNLSLRGYAPVNVPKSLIDLSGSTDSGAPNLRGLFRDGRLPAIAQAYQVYNWDWGANARGDVTKTPQVTLLGLQATTGEIINTPDNGGDLGEGYTALVLYASPSRITLKYTREDNVVNGYTLHLENVCVEPSLLALYQKMNDAGRGALPALHPGQPLGRAVGSQIGVAIRDKGTFMETRSRKDWWK